MVIACDVAMLQLTGSPEVSRASGLRNLFCSASFQLSCSVPSTRTWRPLLYCFVMHRGAHCAHLATQAMGLTLSRNLWASANPAYVFRDPMHTVSAYKQDFLWDEDEVRPRLLPRLTTYFASPASLQSIKSSVPHDTHSLGQASLIPIWLKACH